jgi:iron complex outermembrane receptor protein
MRSLVFIVTVVVCAAHSLAVWADGGADSPDSAPSIPVGQLPPLPGVTPKTDEIVGVTVVGATQAEVDIVVGAAKREQSLGSVASAVTVISADRLRRFGYRTLAEALGAVAGLYIVNDRALERLGIRGVQLLGDANTRILLLIDGSPINEPWSQGVDTSRALPIHIDDVARIEIIRGPVSSIYGTNAFLGIINIVSTQADKAAPAYGRLGLATYGGDLTTTGNVGFSRGSLNRQVRATFAWARRSGETVTITPFGTLPDTSADVDADGLDAFNGSVVFTRDRLFVQLRAHSRTRELTGAPFDSLINSQNNTNRDRQLLLEAGYTSRLRSDLSLTTRAYVNRYQQQSDLAFDPFPAFRAVGDSLWYGAEARAGLDLSRLLPRGTFDVTAGLAAERAHTDSSAFEIGSSNQVEVSRNLSILGAYTELNVAPTRWFSATVGARFDSNTVFDNALSPRTALFFRSGERFGFKLLYARGFRNPSVFEAFFADGRRFTPSCTPACDVGTSLLPEKIRSYEAVAWVRPFPGLKLRASVWDWRMDNLIEKERVLDQIELTETLQYKNVFVGFTARGVEIEATYRDTRGWVGYASTTLADVERGNARASNSPRATAKLGASTPRLRGVGHLSTELAYIGARTVSRVGIPVSAELDPHLAWNMTAYVPDYRGFDFTLGVRNILGSREQVAVQGEYDRKDPDGDGPLGELRILTIPGPGREFFLRVGYRY